MNRNDRRIARAETLRRKQTRSTKYQPTTLDAFGVIA